MACKEDPSSADAGATWVYCDLDGSDNGFSTDQKGNFYTAAVDTGGAQKFTPRAGANPAMLVGKPLRVAWK